MNPTVKSPLSTTLLASPDSVSFPLKSARDRRNKNEKCPLKVTNTNTKFVPDSKHTIGPQSHICRPGPRRWRHLRARKRGDNSCLLSVDNTNSDYKASQRVSVSGP